MLERLFITDFSGHAVKFASLIGVAQGFFGQTEEIQSTLLVVEREGESALFGRLCSRWLRWRKGCKPGLSTSDTSGQHGTLP